LPPTPTPTPNPPNIKEWRGTDWLTDFMLYSLLSFAWGRAHVFLLVLIFHPFLMGASFWLICFVWFYR
jgi:hypothetical protein